jgi:hypothetical protein
MVTVSVAYQKSNTIDADSSLDLDCYDHLNARNTRETMLSENLYSSNVGPRSNTDPTRITYVIHF